MMNNLILFDDENWTSFLPLTFTRPIGELRIGIDTIREKWEYALAGKASYITKDHLTKKYPITIKSENILINGSVLPTRKLELLIKDLKVNEAILMHDQLIAAKIDDKQFIKMQETNELDSFKGIELGDSEEDVIMQLTSPTQLFSKNDFVLRKDFERITAGRKSEPLPSSNQLIGSADQIFIEKGATVEACIFNTKTGPIYIGHDVLIMEGAMIRGPFAALDHTVVKMGAKVYGATSLGPYCKIGGEVNNVVMYACSNKAHDGYLGNAAIGEWCNLGADTNASNLKNNYDEVKLWSYATDSFVSTGLQFCGLVMGDHSKTGINTMLNTGTVIGVSTNVFGDGFPRNFIPSFAWGGPSGYTTYKIEKALETCERVYARRGMELTKEDADILTYIYHDSKKYRTWEKPTSGKTSK
ncbi:MAG: GlmU family protein [Saprospiraceae bacterium]